MYYISIHIVHVRTYCKWKHLLCCRAQEPWLGFRPKSAVFTLNFNSNISTKKKKQTKKRIPAIVWGWNCQPTRVYIILLYNAIHNKNNNIEHTYVWVFNAYLLGWAMNFSFASSADSSPRDMVQRTIGKSSPYIGVPYVRAAASVCVQIKFCARPIKGTLFYCCYWCCCPWLLLFGLNWNTRKSIKWIYIYFFHLFYGIKFILWISSATHDLLSILPVLCLVRFGFGLGDQFGHTHHTKCTLSFHLISATK